jgi:type IV pilus assembly protein PilQ
MKFIPFLLANNQINMKIKLFQLLSVFLFSSFIFSDLTAQERIKELENELKTWSENNPALLESVDISVSDVSIQEFLRGVARNVHLNITVDPSLQYVVVNNFSDVKVMDILLHLCKEYNLNITSTGSILSVEQYNPPKQKAIVKKNNQIVNYNKDRDLLTLDIKKDTLSEVVHLIIDKSGKNLVMEAGISNMQVEGYIKEMPFDNSIEKFAFANGLSVEKTSDNFYVLSEQNSKVKQQTSVSSISSNKNQELIIEEGVEFEIFNRNNISVKGSDIDVASIIKVISDSLRINYSMLSNINEKVSVNLLHSSYDDLLLNLLEGTTYRYQKRDDVYLIGEKSDISVHQTETVYMNHRSVDKIIEFIPTDLKTDVELLEFMELNALFITGHPQQVEKVKNFVKSIDQPVPVILIEILIVDIYKQNVVSTGIRAGFGENPKTSSQTILPGIDYEFSTQEINNLFGKIDGLGWINLGQVTPDFYLAIEAMEENNMVKIKSTPKLSTLNGHNAILTSGETRYYKEERNNYIGTQNPALSNSYTWKPINADLNITIKPIVSGDEYITLEIDVKQAEFQKNAETGDDAPPPGSVTRGFQSSIRMKNKEMILLGGLDKVNTTKASSGIPILSRIPVLKWFFSSNQDSHTDNKLSIFIQPTVIY